MGILDMVKDFAVRTLDGSLFPPRLPDTRANPEALAAVGVFILVAVAAWTLWAWRFMFQTHLPRLTPAAG